jgi:hypothetical protein
MKDHEPFIDPELPEEVKQVWRVYYMAEELLYEYSELYKKDNRSAGKRARKILLQFGQMYRPMREDILNKMKTIPVKPRKK